jgi:charged multivesicular body protein 1
MSQVATLLFVTRARAPAMGLFSFKSKEDKLLDQIFNLKFTGKQLGRTAAKCEKEEKALKAKARRPRARPFVRSFFTDTWTNERRRGSDARPPRRSSRQVKTAIEKGNIEGAKIYATDSIRKKNEQLNMMKARRRRVPSQTTKSDERRANVSLPKRHPPASPPS